ncbi:MAG TPA: hypothetical protein VM243_13205 [Phycisphaerae bacterium]|nr:hypothetical protein [Phycisphaerae bacterium]
MRPASLRWIVLGTAVLIAGCNWLIPLVFLHPGTKKVPPEFAKLEGRTVAVMVWAEPETLYDYPYVRLELASYVGDKLRAHVKDVQLTDNRKVEDFIQDSPQAALDPQRVGGELGADMVVYIELLEFQMRDPDAPALLQGHIRAAVSVYDLTADIDEAEQYELAGVDAKHPDQPVLFSLVAANRLRSETYDKFADLVSRKFYTHDEEL